MPEKAFLATFASSVASLGPETERLDSGTEGSRSASELISNPTSPQGPSIRLPLVPQAILSSLPHGLVLHFLQ